MIEWLLLITIIALLYLFWRYSTLRNQVENRARVQFDRWRESALAEESDRRATLLANEWVQKEESRIRKDAIGKSEAVITGRVTEHMVPFFPAFSYNPKDARFLGSPVDFVVFDGLAEGDLRRVVFLEVKSGKYPTLSARERQVKECITSGEVTYEVIHHRREDQAGPDS